MAARDLHADNLAQAEADYVAALEEGERDNEAWRQRRLAAEEHLLAQRQQGITERNGLEFDADKVKNITGRMVQARGRIGQALLREHGIPIVGDRRGVPPRYDPVGPIEARNTFRERKYEADSAVTTFGTLAKAIARRVRARGNAFRGAKVAFADATDPTKVVYRVVGSQRHVIAHPHDNADAVAVEIERQLERMSFGATATEASGSDAIPDYYLPDLSTFAETWVDVPAVGAFNTSYKKPLHMLYELRDYQGKGGDCVITIMRIATGKHKGVHADTIRRKCGLDHGPVKLDVENLTKLANHFGSRICIYSDEPSEPVRAFKDDVTNVCIATLPENMLLAVTPEGVTDETGTTSVHLMWHEPSAHAIHIARHRNVPLCPITGDIVIKKRTKQEIKERVLEQERDWLPATRLTKKPVKRTYKSFFFVFDFETVNTAKGTEPYSASYYRFPVERDDANFADDRADCGFITSRLPAFDVADQLLALIRACPDDEKNILVGFNSSRFDNFMLASAAARRETLSNIFWANGSLRGLNIGRHAAVDLAKLLPIMSLKTACDSFKTNPIKDEGFDHAVVQSAYREGNLAAWIKANRTKLAHYNSSDVLATASLLIKVISSIKEATGLDPITTRKWTLGGITYAAFLDKVDPALLPDSTDEETDTFIRASIVGGRTQCLEGPMLVRDEPLAMIDVASLYPAAMMGVNADLIPEPLYGRFPSGEPTASDEYREDKLGVWSVLIVRQPKVRVLPRRGETHDWDAERFGTVTTSISINAIRRHGGEVIVGSGYYWENDTTETFRSYLGGLASAKDSQDRLMKAKDPKANPALREMLKALMNSLSGKCAEGRHDDVAILCKNRAQEIKAENSMQDAQSTGQFHFGAQYSLLTGKKAKGTIYNQKRAKPAIIATLIYEHARLYLYELVLSRYRGYYTDTDSCLMPWDEYKRFRADNPKLDPTMRGKRIGDLEEELHGDADSKFTAMIVRPKLYGVIGPGVMKLRMKGINPTQDRLVRPGDIKRHADGEAADVGKLMEFHNKTRPVKEELVAFFGQLAERGSVTVLASQFTRGLVDGAGFGLGQRYMLKTLTAPECFRKKARMITEERIQRASAPAAILSDAAFHALMDSIL
jgi:hypothetical protein